MGMLCTIIPLIAFPFYTETPIELCRGRKKAECRSELERMYKTEYDVRKRYGDIQNALRLTDKYNVSIFSILTCPSRYRNALIVGILIGISQGIINSFFENFLCKVIKDSTSFLYCDTEALSLTHVFF